MDYELSIIVPCYNVPLAKLRQCIESLLFIPKILPTEIWVIDDGSEEDIAVPYVDSLGSPHIHALRQANSGAGGARNTGIEHSQGQYVTFVDADDYVYYGPYVEMLKELREKQPDILAQGYSFRYEGPATAFMLEHDIHASCCSYIIRRSLLQNLRFTPGIFHEDEEFSTRLHLLRAHLVAVNYCAYFYRYEPDSITHNTDRSHVEKRFEDYITVLQHLQSHDVPSPHDLALQRRIDIMAMCYVVTLMRDMHSAAEIRYWLGRLSQTGLYPLPLRWRGLRYSLAALITRRPLLVNMLSPLVKLFYKIQDASTEKRAFVAHADLVNAEQPEV